MDGYGRMLVWRYTLHGRKLPGKKTPQSAVHLWLTSLAEKGGKLEVEKEMGAREYALMHTKKARQLATSWEEVDGKVAYDTTGESMSIR